jgi:hypothetical protein
MFERKVQQFDRSLNLINTHRSASHAARSIGIKNSVNINQCCRGLRKTAYGFIWKYEPSPDLPNEVWKNHPVLDIKVSNLGRIETLYGYRTYGTLNCQNGYMNYQRKGKSYGIHRLVFQTFNPEINFEVVHHLNRIRNDNRLENLMGCTQKENIQAYHDLIPKLY